MIRSGFSGLFVITGILVMFCLTGCGTSPESRFYALNSLNLSGPAPARGLSSNNVVVSVGPVTIPEYLDRQQIVTRTSQNQLSLAEFDLWGGSLQADVNRVLVENLNTLFAPEGISAIPWRTQVSAQFKVPVSITRFEAQGDTVFLRAQWSFSRRDGTMIETVSESVITKALPKKTYTDVASVMSDALGDLSKEIAAVAKSAMGKENK